jgi:hypothetical protein
MAKKRCNPKECCSKGHKGCKKEHGGGGALFLSMALGAALAAGAGYYVTHKEEVDREAKKRIDELAKLFKETRAQVEPKVRKVWGDVTEETVAKYMDLRGALLDALEDERVQNAGELLKGNYEEIVENSVKSARKSGILDAATEKKLEKLFKTDWNKVKEVLITGAEVATSVATKSAKQAGRAAKKAVKKATRKPAAKKTGAKRKTAKKVTKKKPTKKTTRKKPVLKAGARKTAKKKK